MSGVRTLAPMVGLLLIVGACKDPCANHAHRAPTPIDPAATGTVEGSVRVEGPLPPDLLYDMSGDCHAGRVPAGSVLVKDGNVRNAWVRIVEGLNGKVFPVPAAPVQLDQKACLFVPRVLGVQVCQPIEIHNSDPAVHNVRTAFFNITVSSGQVRVEKVHQPGVHRTRCDIHTWMEAFICAVDHPYFQVTGEDGAFRLSGVPEGTYTLAAWHERFGELKQQIRVERGKTTSVGFVFRP